MANTAFHGSRTDIKDSELKPLGWSRHIESNNSLYVTESKELALHYVLDYMNIDDDNCKTFCFYDTNTQEWNDLIVVESESTPIGYIYEVDKPSESPVSYYDEQTGAELHKYQDGAKAIWAVQHSMPILHRHVVDYNYIKQTPVHVIVRVLKKQKVFQEATKEIKRREMAIEDAQQKDKAAAIENFRRTLDEYTDL